MGLLQKRIEDLLLPLQKGAEFKVPLFNNLRIALDGVVEEMRKEFNLADAKCYGDDNTAIYEWEEKWLEK